MDETLKRDDDIWAVNLTDPNDGRNYPAAYFTSHGKAAGYASAHGGIIRKTTLYRGADSGEFYRVHAERVGVDIPERSEVLARLTPAEREALGLR